MGSQTRDSVRITAPVTVDEIFIQDGYAHLIELDAKLTVNKRLEVRSPAYFSTAGGDNALNRGEIVLAAGSKFNWGSGTLERINLTVSAGAVLDIDAHHENESATFPALVSSDVSIDGTFDFGGRNLEVDKLSKVQAPSRIKVNSGGTFKITGVGVIGAPSEGSDEPNHLLFENEGKVIVETSSRIVGNFWNINGGKTYVKSGDLELAGQAVQTGSTSRFELTAGSMVSPTGKTDHALLIRDGLIAGSGKIGGDLILGYGPGSGKGPTAPVISPWGSGGVNGQITVTGNFQMFSGNMQIGISGPNESGTQSFDKVVVGGWAVLDKSAQAIGALNPAHAKIDEGTRLRFLRTQSLQGSDFSNPYGTPGKDWTYGAERDPNGPEATWFAPTKNIAATVRPIRGRAFGDGGVTLGEFEPGNEDVLSGVAVELWDAKGTTKLATDVTDANGEYEFPDLGPGAYQVAFVRPTSLRFSPANSAADTLDSDADPITGRVLVDINGDMDLDRVDVGFYSNSDPEAIADSFLAHIGTSVVGNVMLNDSDADADALSVEILSGVAHGTLDLDPNGTFVYTPDANWTGTDTFTYTLSDSYEGTHIGTVTIVVAGTAAPIGVSDVYTVPVIATFDDEDGVLANDTDQNNGTLIAVMGAEPANGTVDLNLAA